MCGSPDSGRVLMEVLRLGVMTSLDVPMKGPN